jgi:hypothetical protein
MTTGTTERTAGLGRSPSSRCCNNVAQGGCRERSPRGVGLWRPRVTGSCMALARAPPQGSGSRAGCLRVRVGGGRAFHVEQAGVGPMIGLASRCVPGRRTAAPSDVPRGTPEWPGGCVLVASPGERLDRPWRQARRHGARCRASGVPRGTRCDRAAARWSTSLVLDAHRCPPRKDLRAHRRVDHASPHDVRATIHRRRADVRTTRSQRRGFPQNRARRAAGSLDGPEVSLDAPMFTTSALVNHWGGFRTQPARDRVRHVGNLSTGSRYTCG